MWWKDALSEAFHFVIYLWNDEWFCWESGKTRCCLKLLRDSVLSFITTFSQVSMLSVPWHLSKYKILDSYLRNNLDCEDHLFFWAALGFVAFHSLLSTPFDAETKEAGFCTR